MTSTLSGSDSTEFCVAQGGAAAPRFQSAASKSVFKGMDFDAISHRIRSGFPPHAATPCRDYQAAMTSSAGSSSSGMPFRRCRTTPPQQQPYHLTTARSSNGSGGGVMMTSRAARALTPSANMTRCFSPAGMTERGEPQGAASTTTATAAVTSQQQPQQPVAIKRTLSVDSIHSPPPQQWSLLADGQRVHKETQVSNRYLVAMAALVAEHTHIFFVFLLYFDPCGKCAQRKKLSAK